MSDADTAAEAPAIGPKKDRSPSFPFVTLTKAIVRTRELYAVAKRHDMRLAEAASAMGYGAKSSGAIQTLAALIAFGLVDDSGSGNDRKFRVSELGFKVLEDQRPGAKEAALAEAALRPKMIAEYKSLWGDRPGDSICLSDLRVDGGFTEDGAKQFLRVFDDAMTYAKVGASDKPSDNGDTKPDDEEGPPPEIAVGDFVSVEAAGQIIYEKTRVRAITPPWVFVEASQSGVDMSDVALVEKATAGGAKPPVLPFDPKPDTEVKSEAGEEMDRFTVDEGVVKIIFPSDITTASLDDLEDFFALFIKKAKRRAGTGQKAN